MAPPEDNAAARGKSRVPRGPGFSAEEVKFLFKTVEALLPGSMDEWDALARDYNARFPLAARSGESLRRKFLKLGRGEYTERARRIKVLIQKRLRKEAGFQLPEDLEEDEADAPARAPLALGGLAGDDRSGTDSEARGGRGDRRTEGGDDDGVDAPNERGEDAAEMTASGGGSGSLSGQVSASTGAGTNAASYDGQDRRDAAASRVAGADAVARASEGLGGGLGIGKRLVETERVVSEHLAAPASDVVAHGSPPVSVAAATAAAQQTVAPHCPLASEQQQEEEPSEQQLSNAPQRETTEVSAVSAMPAELSSPAVASRWFALEERRVRMEEQRVAVEQRRLAVEERRVRLLEQRMESDATERSRLLEILQLALRSRGGA